MFPPAQIDIFIAQQFLFQKQWQKVRNYARERGISIMGDMPIYVGYHSADVWANKKHFVLVRITVQNKETYLICYSQCLLPMQVMIIMSLILILSARTGMVFLFLLVVFLPMLSVKQASCGAGLF